MNVRMMTLMSACVLAGSLDAQSMPRRAAMIGGGSPDSGKCTVEVIVDGAAEVEIRGDTAVLRNLKGQTPQWRRFECSGPLPAQPANFRFSGVDGRGRQQLVQDPRNNRGTAVVRIEDPDNGSEGYTFDIRWDGSNQYQSGGRPEGPPIGGGYGDRLPNRRFAADQAVNACQDAVRRQAAGRFDAGDIQFRRTNIDEAPGRNEWVVGSFEVRRRDRSEIYRFSCSIDFERGQVRSASIEPAAADGDRRAGDRRDGDRGGMDRAMANCRRGVEDRLHQDGFDNIEFRSINVDDRPGRNDWIVGNVRAEGRNRAGFFDFSCSVQLRDGDLRSVDVRRR